MAVTLERLTAGIAAADASGDYETAAKLRQAYEQLLSQGNQPVQAQTAEQPTGQPVSGLGNAFGQGLDQLQVLGGKGIQSIGELTGVEGIEGAGAVMAQIGEDRVRERNYQRPENLDGILSNIREGDPLEALGSAGYSLAEGVPSILPGAVASLPGVGWLARGIGAGITGVTALGDQRQEAEDQGLDGSASWQDAAAALASVGLELIPGPNGAGYAVTATMEGMQEGAQELVTILNTELKGGEYTPDQIINRVVDSGITGGTIGAGARAIQEATPIAADAVRSGVQAATDRIRYDSGFDSDDMRAAQAIMESADFDPRVLANVSTTEANVSAQGAAKGALITRRQELNQRLAALRKLAKDQGISQAEEVISALEGDFNSQDNSNPLLRVLGMTDGSGGVSRNHTSTTSEFQLKRLQEIFPEVTEAQEAASLARQIKKLKPFTQSMGDLGGLGQYTRHFDSFDGRNNSIARVLSAATLGKGILVNRTARMIDKATNNRSRIKRYVESVVRENPDVVPYGGSTAQSILADMAETKAQTKLFQDAISSRQKDQDSIQAAKWAREDAEFNRMQKEKAKEQKTQRVTLDQSKGTSTAQPDPSDDYIRSLHVEATRQGFENSALGSLPPGSAYDPYRAWEQATGMSMADNYMALQALEQRGVVASGTAKRFREDPRSFWDSKKGKKEAYALQGVIKDNFRSDWKPKEDVSEKGEKALRKLEATDGRPTGSRRKEKAWEGGRRRRNLTAEIDRAKSSLNSAQFIALHGLAETIDSPAMTRDMRMELINRQLPRIFRGNPVAAEFWKKEFGPLAQIGNDYVIERQSEEQAKEEAFEEKIEAVKTASKRKKKKDRKSPAPEAPKQAPVEQQPEPVQQPQTRADRALEKLQTPVEDKPAPAEEEAPKATNVAVVDAQEIVVEQPKTKGRASLADQLNSRLEKIEYMKEMAELGAQALADYMAILPKNVVGRLEGLILRGATDMITQNDLTNSYAAITGLPPDVAAQEVERGLAIMEKEGLISRSLKVGQTNLVVDGEYKTGPDGERLKVVHVEVDNPDLQAYLEVAKALSFVNRMVNQEAPEVQYAPGQLSEGPHQAFKDYDDSQIDATFMPAINFLNDLRAQRLSVHSDILDQIEEGMEGSGNKKVGAIAEVLTPMKGALKPKKDDSPLRAVAQLFDMMGTGEDRVDTSFRQEWMFGANLRAYSKNGTAHTQSGDLMKGLTRMGEKSSVGSVQGIDMMLHTFGNILGKDKASPEERRGAIFEDGVIDSLLKFAEDPFGRDKLKRGKDQPTALGKLVEKSEGFFQTLNVAHEVAAMVAFARERNPKLKNMTPRELLMHPAVKEDLAKNYQTDYIVQLDASNNAYQLMGLVTGYQKMLQATGLIPPNGVNNLDAQAPADIYTDPAKATASRIPELAALDLPASKIRKIFKNAIGTFLYEAEYNSRKESLAEMLAEVTKKARLSGFDPEEAVFVVPPAMQAGMLSEKGFTFNEVSYDVNGNVKEQKALQKRVTKTPKGFRIETAGPSGKWKAQGMVHETAEDAITAAHESDILVRMNRELVREINTQYPRIQEYLRFAGTVSQIMKARGQQKVRIPTPDGMMLETSFTDDFEYLSAPVDLGNGKVVPMGYRGTESKLTGRGVAAFMMHQLDAYVLREVHRRMKAEGLLKTGFNPIHDSFGFAPADAKRGQEVWAEVMQELGQEDYNIFHQVLEANGISMTEFMQNKGVIPAREGVKPQSQSRIPTALS